MCTSALHHNQLVRLARTRKTVQYILASSRKILEKYFIKFSDDKNVGHFITYDQRNHIGQMLTTGINIILCSSVDPALI